MQFLSTSEKIKDGSFKRAFVRADLDVPLDEAGKILETFRLDVLLPTLNFLIKCNIQPVIGGHMGRPKGVYSRVLSTERLKPFFDAHLGEGNYVLLENLRFNPGENAKDLTFGKELASEVDFYVNESFATCHRDTTSIVTLPQFLPSFVGLRLEKELENLEKVMDPSTVKKPSVALVGGVKKSKKEAIYALSEYFDYVLVGGALKQESEDPETYKVFYPLDYSNNGLDIGPRTENSYSNIISEASTVVWAGPMGAYDQGYSRGSEVIAKAVLSSSAYSIVGGGDTITCLNQLGLLDSFDFISTGGGAMLDFLSNKKLPGLEALNYYG